MLHPIVCYLETRIRQGLFLECDRLYGQSHLNHEKEDERQGDEDHQEVVHPTHTLHYPCLLEADGEVI